MPRRVEVGDLVSMKGADARGIGKAQQGRLGEIGGWTVDAKGVPVRAVGALGSAVEVRERDGTLRTLVVENLDDLHPWDTFTADSDALARALARERVLQRGTEKRQARAVADLHDRGIAAHVVGDGRVAVEVRGLERLIEALTICRQAGLALER